MLTPRAPRPLLLLPASRRWGPALAVALLLGGCLVPKKKLEALEAELASTRSSLEAQLAARTGEATSLQEALTTAEARLAALEKAYASAQAEHSAARVLWEKERDGLAEEKASLLKDKSALRASLAETEEALRDLAARRAAAEERVRQYRDLLGRFKSLIDAGRLKVKIVDGRMIVELATDVLFDSGKAELSEGGRKAIADVAGVLAAIPERSFQVEGHTDNVPIANERFPSNWELASARSIVVVRALIAGGVAPSRVSGASFAEYHPVRDNTSPEGKAANRRIEIVVVPDLSLLPGSEELKQAASE